MAVVIRLSRHGAKSRPFYRVVALEKGSKRDGGFIEQLGTYNPKVNPPAITFKEERIKRWIAVGAKPSRLVRDALIKKYPGLVEEREKHQRAKIIAARKARKARAAKRPAK